MLKLSLIFAFSIDFSLQLDLSLAEDVEWELGEHSELECLMCGDLSHEVLLDGVAVRCLCVDREYIGHPRDCSTPTAEDYTTPEFLDTSSDPEESVEVLYDAMDLDQSMEILFDSTDEIMDGSHLNQPMENLSFVTGSPCSMEMPDYSWHSSMAPSPTYGSGSTPSPSRYAPTSPLPTRSPSPPVVPIDYVFLGTITPDNLHQFPELNVQYGVWRNNLGNYILSQYFN